jgi:hypothetical protein
LTKNKTPCFYSRASSPTPGGHLKYSCGNNESKKKKFISVWSLAYPEKVENKEVEENTEINIKLILKQKRVQYHI